MVPQIWLRALGILEGKTLAHHPARLRGREDLHPGTDTACSLTHTFRRRRKTGRIPTHHSTYIHRSNKHSDARFHLLSSVDRGADFKTPKVVVFPRLKVTGGDRLCCHPCRGLFLRPRPMTHAEKLLILPHINNPVFARFGTSTKVRVELITKMEYRSGREPRVTRENRQASGFYP